MLTFDDSLDERGERRHVYQWNGVDVPSVTTILKTVGYNPYFGEHPEAMELGRLVHKTTALYDEGDLDETTLHPILTSYLDGWKRFRDEWRPVRTTIVDLKSGSSVPWSVGIQLALYELVYRDFLPSLPGVHDLIERPMYASVGVAGTPDRVYRDPAKPCPDLIDRLCVHLPGDGKYRLYPCRRRKDRDMARATIALYYDAHNHCQ